MINLEEVMDEVKDESITEKNLEKVVKRVKGFLMSYCNNTKMFDNVDDFLLEEVVFYLVCERFNEDVKGRQGLDAESIGGVSFTFEKDLPVRYKNALRRYKRANFK